MSEPLERGTREEGAAARGAGEPDAEATLESRLRRLEEILGSLEAEDVGLERALALFEEGVRHVREAERQIAQAELRVEELLGEEGGWTRPFRGESE